MRALKYISLVAIILLPALCIAQNANTSATDCPTWDNKHTSTKLDYLKYLRQNQGKKVKKDSIYFPEEKPAEQAANKATIKPAAEKGIVVPKQNSVYNESEKQKMDSVPAKKEIVKTEIVTAEKSEPIVSNESESTAVQTEQQTSVNIEQKEQPVKEAENSGLSPEKKQPSKFKKRLTLIFTKKNNKAPKPNYKKCSTPD